MTNRNKMKNRGLTLFCHFAENIGILWWAHMLQHKGNGKVCVKLVQSCTHTNTVARRQGQRRSKFSLLQSITSGGSVRPPQIWLWPWDVEEAVESVIAHPLFESLHHLDLLFKELLNVLSFLTCLSCICFSGNTHLELFLLCFPQFLRFCNLCEMEKIWEHLRSLRLTKSHGQFCPLIMEDTAKDLSHLTFILLGVLFFHSCLTMVPNTSPLLGSLKIVSCLSVSCVLPELHT